MQPNNLFSRITTSIANMFSKKPNEVRNIFQEAFLWATAGYTQYDTTSITYLEKGYNINPIVYSVINQQATKTASIPVYVKKIKDKKASNNLKAFKLVTKGAQLTPQQMVKKLILENKAFEETDLQFPMERPNTEQTWAEFMALWKTFMKLNGNAYMYMLTPEMGQNANTPIQIYLLPSHLVQIVIKPISTLMYATDSAVKGYMLYYGNKFLEFPAEVVIHTKYPNPNYDESGSHLYGMAPLRASLRNIQNSNEALDLNIKMMKSGGAFGLIHSKSQTLTVDQVAEIKERLKEMDRSPENLARISGVSAEVGFIRMSLTSDELKPFDYLNYDQKQICNVLNWSDKLLNNDESSTYDNINQERKRVITDNIEPDLKIFEQAMNKYFLPRFKGYENSELYFDFSELPEMQTDTSELVKWLSEAKDRGVITGNEFRLAISYPLSDDKNMDRFTVANDIIPLEEAMDNTFNVQPM